MKTNLGALNKAYESPDIELIRLELDAIMASGLNDDWNDYNDRNELY